MTVKIGIFAMYRTQYPILQLLSDSFAESLFVKYLPYFAYLPYLTLPYLTCLPYIDALHGPGLGTSAILISVWGFPTRQDMILYE